MDEFSWLGKQVRYALAPLGRKANLLLEVQISIRLLHSPWVIQLVRMGSNIINGWQL